MSENLVFSLTGAAALGLAAGWMVAPLAHAGAKRLALAVAAALLLAGGGAYVVLGTPVALEPAARLPQPPLEQLVAELAQRMNERPDDARGWVMLGKAYVALGRYAEAQEAYRRARTLTADGDPAALAGWAEARILEDPTRLVPEAAPLFAKVLELSPTDAKGLWYGALARIEQGDAAGAENLFARLLAQDPPEELRAAIERRRAALAPGVRVRVELAPGSAPPADGEVALYVYLRRPGEAMPVAARKLPLSTLPADLVLGPADRLQPDAPWPATEALVLGARLGARHEATRRSGDPYGEIELAAGQLAATVVMDRRVP